MNETVTSTTSDNPIYFSVNVVICICPRCDAVLLHKPTRANPCPYCGIGE